MVLLSVLLAASLSPDDAGIAVDAYLGRWNMRIVDADAFTSGWFKIDRTDSGLAASILWRWGGVGPATKAEVENGTLRLVREVQPGKVDTFEARVKGNSLEGQVRYADGKSNRFEGRRAPELPGPANPDWGAKPVTLFDGKTLNGWKPRDPRAKRGWSVVNGELAVVDPQGNSDLVSEKKFQDMRLHLEFNVEPRSNSGVYLRGRYEIQILDDPSTARDTHGCGALYSRIAPSVDATKPAGEWQTLDITLLGRRLSVVLNGQTVIENAQVDGITGGALDTAESEPGPLMLQGDHGKVRFRNIVVTPAR